MAPEFGETQATPQFGISSSALVQDRRDNTALQGSTALHDNIALPTMDDLDVLVAELDVIDATLAQLG